MAGTNVADVEALPLQTFFMREEGNKWVNSNEFKGTLSILASAAEKTLQ